MKKNIVRILAMMSLFFCITAFAGEAHYSIVVDAGSSGTRMHLFKYTVEEKVPLISYVFLSD